MNDDSPKPDTATDFVVSALELTLAHRASENPALAAKQRRLLDMFKGDTSSEPPPGSNGSATDGLPPKPRPGNSSAAPSETKTEVNAIRAEAVRRERVRRMAQDASRRFPATPTATSAPPPARTPDSSK